QNQLITLHRGDESETDSGVAAGRLDEHSLSRMNLALALSLGDHAHADAIFHASQRILALELRHDFGDAAFRDFVQPYQRRVANQLRDVFCDFHLKCTPPVFVCGSFPAGFVESSNTTNMVDIARVQSPQRKESTTRKHSIPDS